MKICFFAISCGIVYNDLLKMPFLAKIDTGISIVHLMMKYHNNFSKPVVVTTNLHGERRIHEATLNNLLSNIVISDKSVKEICEATSLIDPVIREDETP